MRLEILNNYLLGKLLVISTYHLHVGEISFYKSRVVKIPYHVKKRFKKKMSKILVQAEFKYKLCKILFQAQFS